MLRLQPLHILSTYSSTALWICTCAYRFIPILLSRIHPKLFFQLHQEISIWECTKVSCSSVVNRLWWNDCQSYLAHDCVSVTTLLLTMWALRTWALHLAFGGWWWPLKGSFGWDITNKEEKVSFDLIGVRCFFRQMGPIQQSNLI